MRHTGVRSGKTHQPYQPCQGKNDHLPAAHLRFKTGRTVRNRSEPKKSFSAQFSRQSTLFIVTALSKNTKNGTFPIPYNFFGSVFEQFSRAFSSPAPLIRGASSLPKNQEKTLKKRRKKG
jgi:hypothetical protein